MNLFNHLVVETIGSCNRTCSTCLRQSYPEELRTDKHRERTVEHKIGEGLKLPTETFLSVLDQAASLGFKGRTTLQFYNEPLLDDRFVELLHEARARLRGTLTFCTNADLMTPEIAADIDGIADEILVALYMPQRRQTARAKELNAMFSKTRLKFTGGTHVTTHFSPRPNLVRLTKKHAKQPCTTYNRMFIVTASGEVAHCCDDYVGHFDLGNVRDTPIRELWFGERYRALVGTLSKPGGRQAYEYCKVCPRR